MRKELNQSNEKVVFKVFKDFYEDRMNENEINAEVNFTPQMVNQLLGAVFKKRFFDIVWKFCTSTCTEVKRRYIIEMI